MIRRFLDVYGGLFRLFLWGRGHALTERQRFLLETTLPWTVRFFSPALMKPLDIMVADHLLTTHDWDGPILDAGCGAARFANSLFSRQIGSLPIDGLDLELELESNIESGKRDILRSFHKCSFSETGLPGDSYGLIFSNNAVQASPDMDGALTEFHRLLKVGGVLVFNVTTPAHEARLKPEWGRLPRYYGTEDIRAIVEAHSFQVIEIVPYNSGFFTDIDFARFVPAYKELWPYEVDPKAQRYGAIYTMLHGAVLPVLRLLGGAYARAFTERGGVGATKLYVLAVKR